MTTDYNKQAKDFLEKHGLLLTVREAVPQTKAPWSSDKGVETGINYWVELKQNKTGGKSYDFHFWDSISNKKNLQYGYPKRPTAYDILACLDVLEEIVTLDDFCDIYGYDKDSRTAEKTWKLTIEQNKGLIGIMNKDALQELSEIN